MRVVVCVGRQSTTVCWLRGEGVQNEEELFHHFAVNYLLPDPKEAATSTGSCSHRR